MTQQYSSILHVTSFPGSFIKVKVNPSFSIYPFCNLNKNNNNNVHSEIRLNAFSISEKILHIKYVCACV